MSLPTSETIPDDFNALSPAQKRRIRYAIKRASETEVQVFLTELKRRATPSFEFFLLSVLGSLISAVAILLDSSLLLFAAAIASPFLVPIIGLALSPALKSISFFLKSLVSIVICAAVYFVGGVFAGLISRLLPIKTLTQLPLITSSNWISWLVLIAAAILCAFFFVRHENNPRLIGTLLVFLIMLPVSAAGIYLFMEDAPSWTSALHLSAMHLISAVSIMSLVFLFLWLRPKNSIGWLFFLAFIIIAIVLVLTQTTIAQPVPEAIFTKPLPTNTLTATPTSTNTPPPPTATNTSTSTFTLTPTQTATQTLTSTPTPIWAIVNSEIGAVIRDEPDLDANWVASAQNGALIRMLFEKVQTGTQTWVKVIAADGTIGWMLRSLLVTATPSP